jgi:tellurite resistance protein TerC
VFIGTKMMLIDLIKIPVLVSLGVVVAILAATMVLSLRTAPRLPERKGDEPQALN